MPLNAAVIAALLSGLDGALVDGAVVTNPVSMGLPGDAIDGTHITRGSTRPGRFT